MSPENKIYIGQTRRDPKIRIYREHPKNSTPIGRAIRKFGLQNFTINEKMDFAPTQEEANRLEEYYIDLFNSYKNGYNRSRFVSETYDKIGKIKGHPSWNRGLTKETDDRVRKNYENRKSRKGIKNPKLSGENNPAKRPEVREKISKAKKGRKRPDMVGDKNPSKRPEVRKKLSKRKRRNDLRNLIQK